MSLKIRQTMKGLMRLVIPMLLLLDQMKLISLATRHVSESKPQSGDLS